VNTASISTKERSAGSEAIKTTYNNFLSPHCFDVEKHDCLLVKVYSKMIIKCFLIKQF